MMNPKTPYRELVDEENLDLLGSLSGPSWAAFQEAWSDAVFFDLPEVQAELQRSLRQTGSIGGDHRRDLKEAVMGQKMPSVALGAPMMQPDPSLNGKADRKERRERPRL